MAQTVRDVMAQQLHTCPASGPVREAAKVMREHDIGDVIVLSDDGSVEGIVTDRDIAVRVIAEGRDPSSTTVGDVCSSDLETISPTDDVERAASIMRDRGVRRLPVTEGGRAVGVISIGDLAIEVDEASALADISAQKGNA